VLLKAHCTGASATVQSCERALTPEIQPPPSNRSHGDTLEGDFGFSAGNGTPEVGHEVKLVNFSREEEPLELKIMRFAHNTTFEQASVSGARGFNRPTNVKFGPDGCAWVVDYGAVRDFGQSDPDAKFIVPGDGPLVQIPHTGVIWRICPQ
jgi:hypothetical protein